MREVSFVLSVIICFALNDWPNNQMEMFFLSNSVVLDLRHLRDVNVQEERVRYLGKGYLLVLRLATGFSHPLTQSATLGSRRYLKDVLLQSYGYVKQKVHQYIH